MDFKEQKLPPNPYSRANPISKLLFLWIIPILKGNKKIELETEDLYSVLKEDEAAQIGDKLERYWEEELENANSTDREPSLIRALLRLSWKTFTLAIIFHLINQLVVVVSQPVFLRLLILTFDDNPVNTTKAYVYATLLSVSVFLQTFITHPIVFRIMVLAMKLRVAVSTLIYRKSLRLSKSAQNETNSGQVVNLLSNDATRFDTNMDILLFVFSAPIQFGIWIYMLYDQIGLASFAGVAFIIILLPMQYYIGKYSATFRLQIAKRTDERGCFMNEIIVGMRVIKQYAWEKPFSALINAIRRLEVLGLRKRGILRGLHYALITFSAKLVAYLTFLAFVLTQNEPLSADKVFFTLSCLHIVVQITIHFTPQAAAGLGEMLVSVKRIQEFLLLEEQYSSNSLKLEEEENGNDQHQHQGQSKISMRNVCASWVENESNVRPTLQNISFEAEGDTLVMVIGAVGSSKTSLLQTILDELPVSSGSLFVQGTVSYASQEPWIFAGNLRSNILFGQEYDEGRYRQTVKACALEEDLRQLPYGDLTKVGERGVALSGGQKARLNLARALYRKSDIYLLDDPLSAVDSRVSRHLFEKCVKEYLKGSIRVLVTHQLQYLPQADYIVVLSQGEILAQGKFQELVDSGVDFVKLLISTDVADVQSKKSNSEEKQIQKFKTELERGKPEDIIEAKVEGAVSCSTYWDYFLSGHTVFGFFTLIGTFILCQIFSSGNDFWLSYWTNAEGKKLERELTACEDPEDEVCKDNYLGEHIYLYVYTGLILAITVFHTIRGLWFYMYCVGTSVNIHERMLNSLVHAPMKFFDETSSGQVMNRFTKDLGTMDELLPPAFIDTINIFLQIVGVMCIVIISNYYLSVPVVGLFFLLYLIRRIFVKTSRDLKRIESIARSPVLTHVTATFQGLTTIRASNSQKLLMRQFEGYQDIHSASWYLFIGANRGFGMWLELLSNTFLVLVAFSFILISSTDKAGNVGLAISSLLTMMDVLQWGMRQSMETENYIISIERTLEYTKLKPEADLESSPELKPTVDWPYLGQIEFRHVSLFYEKDKPVLKNLNFQILPREKIAVVGRTGAGKSSIIAALFRMTEPSGEIIIDYVNIKEIGLHDLRSSISIIPQDPVLFCGTLRFNLDPKSVHKDDVLWKALEEVELKEAIPSLDYLVADAGANFSVGQRQLVCLARALLRRNRILVMDEATANIDNRTDSLIQKTIRTKFASCTIITIAHKLSGIIDCDNVLVLDNGRLMEYNHPHILLQKEQGIFKDMVAQTGHRTNAILTKMAKEAFDRRNATEENNF